MNRIPSAPFRLARGVARSEEDGDKDEGSPNCRVLEIASTRAAGGNDDADYAHFRQILMVVHDQTADDGDGVLGLSRDSYRTTNIVT